MTTVDARQIHVGSRHLNPAGGWTPFEWALLSTPHAATPDDGVCVAVGSLRNRAAAERRCRVPADVSR